MHRFSLVFASASASVLASPVAVARPHFIDVKLIAGSSVPKAGETIVVGLEMVPKPGWHGYWSNPGESGLAPVVKWTAPRGVHFGPLEHPAPTLLTVMGITSYVHAGPHVLVARMSSDRTLPTGTVLPVIADVTWAACSDKLCVPEKARLSLRFTVGNGSPSADAGTLRNALARIPRRLRAGSFTAAGGRIVLRLPSSGRLEPARTRFFPDANGYWDAIKARPVSGRPLMLVSPARGKPPKVITGVVSDGSSAYRVSFENRMGS